MEEHAAAERGRAERLAAALRKSEDKREQIGAKLESTENALIEYEEGLAKANDEIKHLKTEPEAAVHRVGAPYGDGIGRDEKAWRSTGVFCCDAE